MRSQNSEIWEQIRDVDDEEIRSFISSEKKRLGDMLQGFSITWCRTETEYYLELYSEGSQPPLENHPWPYGTGFRLGRTPIMVQGQETLSQLQQAGRAFYYLWRGEIQNLKRDLSRRS